MIVECAHCGAPLDITDRATIFRCKYCNTANERARVRTVAEQTPEDFKPPKKWTPPAEFAADSTRELAYGNKMGGWIIAFVVAVPLVVVLIALLSQRTGIGGTSTSTLAKVTTLDGTPTALSQALGGEAHDTSVWVNLSSDRYKMLSISWDAQHMEHPTYFVLIQREEKTPCDSRVLTKLGESLRGGLSEDDHSWRWERVGIGCDKDGNVSAYVRPDDNPIWKQQLDAAWKLIAGAALGIGVAPTRTEMLDLLGAGYPYANLETISPLTKVDAAADVVKKQFPGAVFEMRGGVTASIAVDHPLFRSVKMEWMNMRDAMLERVQFDPVSAKVFSANRDAFIACLSKAFGAAQVTDADFMKKTKSYSWSPNSMNIYLGQTDVALSVGATPWQHAVAALHGGVLPREAGEHPSVDPAGYANVLRVIGGCHG